jgi:antitoxin MazE
MKTRIQKWGNSLGVRIPKSLASEAGINADTLVEITLIDHQLVIQPTKSEMTLDDLLAQITDDNLHAEIDSGPPMGNEAW